MVFRDPYLQRALFSGPLGEVAVVYFEWAGLGERRVVLPWRLLPDTEDVIAFAALLDGAPLRTPDGETSISEKMHFFEFLLHSNGYYGLRKEVDIASNGTNNYGRHVTEGLKVLSAIGATVDALLLPEPGPDQTVPYARLFDRYDGPIAAYIRRRVVGGPGASVQETDSELEFADAILRELVLKVAWADQ